MSLMLELWSVLTPRQRRFVLCAQLVSIVMAFSTVAGIASIAPFFAVLGHPQLIDQNPLLHGAYQWGFSSTRSFVTALGAAFMLLVVLANLINVAGTFVLIRLATSIGTDLQSILFEEYLDRPYLFHTRIQSALLSKNLIHETTRITNQILQNSFALFTNVATAVFIVVSVMLLNPAVALAMIVALAGGYALIYLAVRNRLLRAGDIESKYAVEQLSIVNESLGAIKEILLLRIQGFFRENFDRSSRAVARAAGRTRLIAQSPRYIMECVAVVGVVAVALETSRGDEGIGPKLGLFSFLGFAAYRLLPTLQQAFAAMVRIRADHPGFRAIAADLQRARARRALTPDTEGIFREHPRREIRLDDVSFRYAEGAAEALCGISLLIPARAAVGFVGANGAGKTTVVDVVAGLLVPQAGVIEVDGIALQDRNRRAWQSRIAYVPQTIVLLDTTIAQNIALGVRPEAIDWSRLHAAATLAQLDEVVATLPGGYEHRVGERGVKLSGGQRQRIGIARALYTDASVLILDEATNALDGLTEQELIATIGRLRGCYTVMVISHRLSAVRGCDLIYELDRGRVAASGTYGDLMRDSAAFRRLAEAQA